MKLLNILPKEEKFYDLLKALTRHAREASEALHHWVSNTDSHVHEQCLSQVKRAKRDAKESVRTITEEACRTFITPFEREDIQELANALYRIPKIIEKVGDQMQAHRLGQREGDLKRFTTLIVRQAEAMDELMVGLCGGLQPNVIHEKAAILDEMEDQGDEAFNQLVTALFRDEADLKELLLRKDLYDLLEDVTDFYRDAAGVGLRIVLKHS